MERSGAARTVGAVVTLLMAALPVAVIATLWALPAVTLGDTELAWAPSAGHAALAVAASGATLVAMVASLRRGAVGGLLLAGASAALAGGSVAVLAAGATLTVPLLAGAMLLLAAVLAPAAGGRLERPTAIGVATTIVVIAECAALAELLPALAQLLDALRPALLAAALAAAAVAAAIALRGSVGGVAGLTAVGAAGMLADRGGSLETVLGLAALVGGQLLAVRSALESGMPEDELSDEERLPELASRLTDAILRFDGRLQLRDWNAAAAALLGLDAGSIGARLEDLLGVALAELPGPDGTTVSRHGVGGLEIAMHRSGVGLTAVVRDPVATPEAERLGGELRATIEDLLRARRTIDLQRGELERSSTVDPLTGVASRGAILERLRLEVAQARRYRHPLAVVLLDLDDFGSLNRAYGIAGGDAALREVALRMRLRVREADALGRAGSDGFLAVLPHTDEAGAATFADALRHRLGLRPVSIGESLVRVTVSIGVATMRSGEDLDVDGLLARVQEALESARSGGGDRIALDRLHGLARLAEAHDAEDRTKDSLADAD